MENKFLDKMYDNMLEEAAMMYLKTEKVSKTKNVKFSEVHEQKMKKLFRKVKNEERIKNINKVTKKVAVILVCTLAITCGLVTSVKAWRKEIIKYIKKNNDDNYMSIKFGEDQEESGDIEETNQYKTDEIYFMYLPEGFEVVESNLNKSLQSILFRSDVNYIIILREQICEVLKESDIEKTCSEKLKTKDKEIFKIVKEDGRTSFLWYGEKYVYEVYSDLEEEEILKVIKNIKILKEI